MHRYRYAILVIFLLSVTACEGPRYLVKQGQKYERGHDYEQAVVYYCEAYSKDPDNRDARKGMKKAGEKLLDEILEDFYTDYRANRLGDAITHYAKAQRLVGNLERRTVELEIPDSTRRQYADAVDRQINYYYQQGAQFVDAGNYTRAKDMVREIEKLDADYEGLKGLRLAIQADPVYTQAMDAYRRGEKGKAMKLLVEVDKIYPNYRETTRIMNELKTNSTVKLGLLPLENQTQEQALGREMNTLTENELLRLRNPLLQVISSGGMGYVPAHNGGWPDEKSLITLAKNNQADRLLLVTVTGYTVEQLPRQENVAVAYLKERVLYYDPYYGQVSNYQFREIKYFEVQEETKVTIQLRFRILNVATGTTSYTGNVSKSVINQIRYADYNGVTDDLYPTTGYISQTDLNQWRTRFKAVNDRKPLSELTRICEEEVVRQLTDDVLTHVFDQ